MTVSLPPTIFHSSVIECTSRGEIEIDVALSEEKEHRLSRSSPAVVDKGGEDDDENDSIPFPADEVRSLEERASGYDLPTLDLNVSGALQQLQLVGVFPTARWLDDKTMPRDIRELFGGTPFFPLGEYRVAHFMLEKNQQITIIVNTGVVGMKSGYWGGAFERFSQKSLATFTCDNGNYPVQPVIVQGQKRRGNYAFFEKLETNLTGPSCKFETASCTNFEKLLSIILEFLLRLNWHKLLPEPLIEITDRSPRIERKQRAVKKEKQKKASKKHSLFSEHESKVFE